MSVSGLLKGDLNSKQVDTSLVALIAANALPLVGVLFFGWDASFIIVIYWTENVVTGFYNILKIVLCHKDEPVAHIGKVFLIPSFLIHYGGFCAVHGAFVLALTHGMGDIPSVFPKEVWWGPLMFLQLLAGVIRQLVTTAGRELVWPVAALVVSHGLSFVQNYLLGGEYKKTDTRRLMQAPYARIVLLHVAILAGGAPVMLLGSPLPLVVLLVLLKTFLDIKLHKKSHERQAKEAHEVD